MPLHAALGSCGYFVYFYVFHIRIMYLQHYADCSCFMISACNLAELHISVGFPVLLDMASHYYKKYAFL